VLIFPSVLHRPRTFKRSKVSHRCGGNAPEIGGPCTGNAYVIVKEGVFASVQSLLSDELAETYHALVESVMGEYNDYVRRRCS
jgi:hypothetical protein